MFGKPELWLEKYSCHHTLIFFPDGQKTEFRIVASLEALLMLLWQIQCA